LVIFVSEATLEALGEHGASGALCHRAGGCAGQKIGEFFLKSHKERKTVTPERIFTTVLTPLQGNAVENGLRQMVCLNGKENLKDAHDRAAMRTLAHPTPCLRL